MNWLNTAIRFFQDGGVFMYFIVAVLALGLAIALERYFYLTRAKMQNKKVWESVTPMLERSEYADAEVRAAKSNSAIGRMLEYGLSRMRSLDEKQDRLAVEAAMEESLMEHMPRFERRTHYLATLANIATLLGLLGTIIGLIQAFTAVAAVSNPADKADQLSASISIAMNTTAFGLMVAIPLLLCHAVLQTKTTDLVDSLEMASVKFLNSVIR